jgi:hypothetical protein
MLNFNMQASMHQAKSTNYNKYPLKLAISPQASLGSNPPQEPGASQYPLSRTAYRTYEEKREIIQV